MGNTLEAFLRMEKVGRATIGGSMPWKRAPKIGISPLRIGLSRVQTVESDDAIVPMMASACFGSKPSHPLVIGSPRRSMKRAPSQFKRISMTLGSSKARQINSPSSSRSLRAKRRRVSSVDIPHKSLVSARAFPFGGKAVAVGSGLLDAQ